jgi:predicted RNA-binding protein YlxR (DUF448 family)
VAPGAVDPDAAQPDTAEADAEPAPEKGPLRRCLVTRESLAKEAMLRFVAGPDGIIVPDVAAKLPGRGMWLSARGDVIERALSRGAFLKATRGQAHPPPDLPARIEDGLRRRIRDLLGFARRAGQAVSGWQAVREALQAGRVGLLVEAADGSEAERARLLGQRPVPVATPLSAAELGGVFGRDHAVHVAIAPGRLAEAIATETARLAGVTSGMAAGVAGGPVAGGPVKSGPVKSGPVKSGPVESGPVTGPRASGRRLHGAAGGVPRPQDTGSGSDGG